MHDWLIGYAHSLPLCFSRKELPWLERMGSKPREARKLGIVKFRAGRVGLRMLHGY